MPPTIQSHHGEHNHVLVHLHSCCPLLLMFELVTVPPRRWSPPKKKTTVKPRVSSSKASNPPLIMSIKSHFPLSLAYACLGDHRDTFFRIVEPIPMHDLSFCHRIKQTTILADLGVDWWACGPYNCYCFCCLWYNEDAYDCGSGWMTTVMLMLTCWWIDPKQRWTMRGCVGIHHGLSRWTLP